MLTYIRQESLRFLNSINRDRSYLWVVYDAKHIKADASHLIFFSKTNSKFVTIQSLAFGLLSHLFLAIVFIFQSKGISFLLSHFKF